MQCQVVRWRSKVFTAKQKHCLKMWQESMEMITEVEKLIKQLSHSYLLVTVNVFHARRIME